MKNYLLLILLLPILLNAQSYHQLLDHESEWHITACSSICKNDIYYTDGDTLYNNYNYSILNGYHYISRTFWLREGVNEKKIYLSYEDGKSRVEVLMYNFSLQVGDTMLLSNPISPFTSNGGFYKVDSIISQTLLDEKDHDFFYLSPTSSNTSSNELPVWVEGIGSLTLINAPGGTPDVNRIGKLSCYFNDGFLSYSQLDSLDRCSVKYVTGIDDIQKDNSKIYPTLFENTLTLELSSEITEVIIYNLSGEVVYRKKLKPQVSEVLDVSKIKKGFYIISLYEEWGPVVSKRIVKI